MWKMQIRVKGHHKGQLSDGKASWIRMNEDLHRLSDGVLTWSETLNKTSGQRQKNVDIWDSQYATATSG